ncbi:MAG TPA: hypothetical protein VME18_04225 [Acidobacteriaceae bacterium]|nr:hypothetical protein [Acidobacteriaceae bacterium]
MQPHFADEWQRLTRLYAEKTDEELLELSEDFAALTETAQQVLRDELRKRRLPEPVAPQEKRDRLIFGWSPIAAAPSPQPSARTDVGDGSLPHEYTWKTLLCECPDQEHAWQISEVLKRAGIESWIEASSGDLDLTGPRVLVAADQLDEARVLAERPIPQDIIVQSKVKEDDFIPPVCPRCGASDPVLLGVDPANTWRCDICGAQWTDSVLSPESEAKPAR